MKKPFFKPLTVAEVFPFSHTLASACGDGYTKRLTVVVTIATTLSPFLQFMVSNGEVEEYFLTPEAAVEAYNSIRPREDY